MSLRRILDRFDRTQQVMWLAIIWVLLGSILWVWWDERTLPDISGRWASVGCEHVSSADGESHLRRFMENASGEWRLRIGFYGDAGCAQELFSLDLEGAYDLGPKSLDVRGATLARFDIRKTTLTPQVPDAAAAFQGAGCGSGGWEVGKGQDVTQGGCLGIVPTAEQCPTEYDLVKIEDDKLYFGDRSQGVCVPDRYPTGFAPAPLRDLDSEEGQGL
jgi:hypothetical protein